MRQDKEAILKTLYMKFLSCVIIYLAGISFCFSQTDSLALKKSKKHIYVSAIAGIPIYNDFGYKNDVSQDHYNIAKSKNKPIYGLNFDFDFNHFTINILANYSKNEFSGNQYKLVVAQLNSGSHQVPIYKYYEIYQTIKYDYLQFGAGLGYNLWHKKHNFALTANVMYNLVNSIKISSYYAPNSALNDRDTSNVYLTKNHKSQDVNGTIAVYGNLRFTYSYLLSKKVMLSFSLNSSFGLFDNYYSSSGSPDYDNSAFGYYVYYQRLIYPAVGIKYMLK